MTAYILIVLGLCVDSAVQTPVPCHEHYQHEFLKSHQETVWENNVGLLVHDLHPERAAQEFMWQHSRLIVSKGTVSEGKHKKI